MLYGITLDSPSTLTLGSHLTPPDPGRYYIANTTFGGPGAPDVPTPMPCDPVFSAPAFLDTTTEGTGWPAGAPPPGLVLKTRPLFTGPLAVASLPSISGLNNDGTWEMGGKSGIDAMDGHGSGAELDDPLLVYIELMEPLKVHYTRVDGFPFSNAFWTDGFASTPSSGPRITGGYVIIAWWWTRPEKDACGNSQESRFILAEEQPDSTYDKLDPEDSDAHPTPVIDTIEPDHGPIAGGDALVIKGSGFGDDATVTVGGNPATSVNVVSQYRIECVTPAHAAGSTDVVVTNVDGVSS